ncbi:intersectin-1 [Condylostylus longicornis]|uniref:intersectin-1 n=1 Tax=Condylostylus longicornis TaxID=2530218 RepID=UPI00244DB61B|nr:intersectin-1 [Condylostylus longicornis]
MNSSADVWVITPKEKEKYVQQFNALKPQNGIVTGGQAKGFFLQSQLPPIVLGQIWALADTDSDGKMDINEFSLACKLIHLKLRGFDIPQTLPPSLLASLQPGTIQTTSPPNAMRPISTVKPVVNELPQSVVLPKPPIGVVPYVAPPAPISQVGNMPVASMAPHGVPMTAPAVSVPIAGTVPITTKPAAVSVLPYAVQAGAIPTTAVPVAAVSGTIMQGNGAPVAGIVPNVATAAPNGSSVQMVQLQMGAIAQGVPPINGNYVQSIPNNQINEVVATQNIAPVLSTEPKKTEDVVSPIPISSPPSQIVASDSGEWGIKGSVKLKYTQVFNTADRNRTGYLTGAQARNILVQSKLPQSILAQVWALSDLDSDGKLSCDEFVLAMYLCDRAIAGEKIPIELPIDLIPPTFRKIRSRHSSISKTPQSSLPASRHASISSQGGISDIDPAAGLPQTSFEDKRKENFDKGQAELERRRKLLQEQQKKEQEERERKEREEAEKKEKARLEMEKKMQEELEEQMRIQREKELEMEEQRKRAIEAKETAKRELEKQRQIEWENQKISEMQLIRNREQEKVLKCKSQNQTLTIELDTLNNRIKELSQKICETRANVTNVKTFIDGMRSTRDAQMSEMAQLKAKIKEQNQKLLQLTQEKIKWDAKAKNAALNEANQAQNNAAFANKQLIIKQLKDKIENIKNDIENKKTDINSNDIQLDEIKDELKTLIGKCDELYISYDTQRNQVLELKNNKANSNLNYSVDNYGTDTLNQSAWATDDNINQIQVSSTDCIKYRALYEFIARTEDEISFQPGDIVLVSNEAGEPGWFKGCINEHWGWFPENYVEKYDETMVNENYSTYDTYSAATTAVDNCAIQEPDVEATTEQQIPNGGENEYYIAAYPYDSSEPDDLKFNAGEIIIVTKKDGDWWTGRIGERVGLFPSNYVEKADIGSGDKNVIKSEVIQNDMTTNEIQNVTAIQQNEESRTQEELDTEVSQINTQKNIENQGSYSRPMSRTSSMTPGMRGKKGEIAQVLAPYEATSSEQLSLVRGQLIMIRKKTDSGWWEGELQAKGRRRQIGWFPASYVKVLQGGRNSGRNTPLSGSKIEMNETILDKVIALYPYKAQNDDELSFEKDDIISVMGRDEPEWWRGELNGLTGLFPSNYVGPFVTSGNV